MIPLKKTARITGALILAMSPFAVFGMMLVPSRLITPGDAAATAANIMASETLFRLGIASLGVVFLLEIAITALLYVLLRPVSKTLSLVAAFSRLAMTVVQGVNLWNHVTALLLLSGDVYLTAFAPEQLQALALLFLNAQALVTHIWGLFFALHLAFLGVLVYRSGYIPRLLGVFLGIAACCYLIQSFGNLLAPAYEEIFAVVGLVSIVELALPIWLVIKGVREPQPGTAAAG
jgi:hypothetical protein